MKSLKEDYSKKIEQFKKKGDNMKCFECNQKGTTYICTTFGTFVCSDCAGVLSHLNYKVKGLGVATFNKNEYEFILKNGNDIAKKKWMAKFDINKDKYPKQKNYEDIRKTIINKYQFKKYCDENMENNIKEKSDNKHAINKKDNKENKENSINEQKNNYKNKDDNNFSNVFLNSIDNSTFENFNNCSNINQNQNKFDFNNFDFNSINNNPNQQSNKFSNDLNFNFPNIIEEKNNKQNNIFNDVNDIFGKIIKNENNDINNQNKKETKKFII